MWLERYTLNESPRGLSRSVSSATALNVVGLAVVPFQLGSGILSDVVPPLFALALAGGVLIGGAAIILSWEAPATD